MALTGNKGEWSELYTFVKLLESGRLYAADENTNKLNNVYTNLEWCSASDNMKHNFNIGLTIPVKNTITQEQIQIQDKVQDLISKLIYNL